METDDLANFIFDIFGIFFVVGVILFVAWGVIYLALEADRDGPVEIVKDTPVPNRPHIMQLHPLHMGKLCAFCDATAEFYDNEAKEYLCADHESDLDHWSDALWSEENLKFWTQRWRQEMHKGG